MDVIDYNNKVRNKIKYKIVMGYITGILIVAILTFGFYSLCELFVRRKERLAIIEKLATGDFKENKFPTLNSTNNYTALNLGCMFVGIGIGLILACFIEFNYSVSSHATDYVKASNDIFEILYPSMSVTFGGVGLLIAYFIERKQEAKKEK